MRIRGILLITCLALLVMGAITSCWASAYKYAGELGANMPAQYFVNPAGVCAGADGVVYVLDNELGRVFLFNQDGKMIRSWTNAALNALPRSDSNLPLEIPMACSAKGILYIVDDNRLLRFDTGGRLISDTDIRKASGETISSCGIAIDSAGWAYITDGGHGYVHKFNPDGAWVGKICKPGKGVGELSSPIGIAVDPEGNLAIANNFSCMVQKFDALGNYLKWSCGGRVPLGSSTPGKLQGWISDVQISSDGVLYITEYAAGSVSKFDRFGKYQGRFSVVDSETGKACQYVVSSALAQGSTPGLWVIDPHQKKVIKLDPTTGKCLVQIGSSGDRPGQLAVPYKLAMDKNGDVYVLDFQKCRVSKFSKTGALISTFGKPGTGKGEMAMPNGIALDPTGKYLYISDQGNGRIEKFTVGGEYVNEFKGTATGKDIWSPAGLGVDSSGNIFVIVQGLKASVQKFSASGALLATYSKWPLSSPEACALDNTGKLYVCSSNWLYKYDLSTGEQVQKIGGPPTKNDEAGKLHYPVDCKIGPNGHLFVVDVDLSGDRGGRVQEFDQNGVFVGRVGGADSGAENFRGASGVAVDSSGDVYVSDVGNHRVARFVRSEASAAVAQPKSK